MYFRTCLTALIFSFNIAFCQQQLLILSNDGTQSSYTVAFSDEFTDVTIDGHKWQNSYPWGRHLSADKPEDESLEYYTDGKNIELKDGKLILETRKERTCGICESWSDSGTYNKNGRLNYQCFNYSSGMIYSKEEFGFGFYEIRFKQGQHSKGLWPAFWLYGNSEEIDVFENKGEKPSSTHWDLHCKNGCNKSYGGWKKVNTDFAEDYQTISFEWLADAEHWFCNGVNYANAKQPYFGKMHIIANNAVSRDKKGKGFWIGPDASTVFPSPLTIDYIRYYTKNYDAITWQRKQKNNELTNALAKQGATSAGVKGKKRSGTNQLMTLYIDGQKHEATFNFFGRKNKKAELFIYNDEGKLVKAGSVTGKNRLQVNELPDEALIIIARTGKKILAERIEVRR